MKIAPVIVTKLIYRLSRNVLTEDQGIFIFHAVIFERGIVGCSETIHDLVIGMNVGIFAMVKYQKGVDWESINVHS